MAQSSTELTTLRKHVVRYLRQLEKSEMVEPEDIAILNTTLTGAIDYAINTTDIQDIKRHLVGALEKLKPIALDTEDREFICETVYTVGQHRGLNLATEVNTWLYGPELAATIARNKPKVIRTTIEDKCENCGVEFKCEILEERPGIPPFWLVVRCAHCNEVVVCSAAPNAANTRTPDYQLITSHAKADFTREQIHQKLAADRKAKRYPFNPKRP